MRFDTIIIGGGLSALTTGIRLAEGGQRVAVVSAGQSTLHFCSGSLDLLGYDAEGRPVANPVEAIGALPDGHPYRKVGDVAMLAAEASQLLEGLGILADGDPTANHYRISPVGNLVPTWLTLQNVVSTDGKSLPWHTAVLANVEGFLDFQVPFLKPALERLGCAVEALNFSTPELEKARRSPSEFRATTIGHYLDTPEAAKAVAERIDGMPKADVVLLPAVFGLAGDTADVALRGNCRAQVAYLPTMHPSLLGTRIAARLRNRLMDLGGEFFASDTVERGDIVDGKLLRVFTHNMVDEALEADNFVLATGSFMSRGLASNYNEVWEPIFRLDVEAAPQRPDWHDSHFFSPQAFMRFGVRTDDRFRAMKDGQAVENLYAVGTVLAGNDFVSLADHEGVDMLTALRVAHLILGTSEPQKPKAL